MKQLCIVYKDTSSFKDELIRLKEYCEENVYTNMLFQVYSTVLDKGPIDELCLIIYEIFPLVPYMGCSTSGNIVDCQVSGEITLVCTIFQDEDTKVKILQYDLNAHSITEVTNHIVEKIQKYFWIKAMEIYCTIPEKSTTQFCSGLKGINPDIQIFGGVSCSEDITSKDSIVFSKYGGYAKNSVVIVLYGGESFYVESLKVTGWKPLGRKFHVTKSDGIVLYELDGIPAYNVYQKYLKIQNDENFFYHTLEFPMFYEHNGTTILRVPVSSNTDNSITMSSDIEEDSIVRISYGDPATIIESIKSTALEIQDFQPDLIHIFSCAARRTFWTSEESTYEIYPLKDIASSSGFFSHGEFLRTEENLNQHNVTLVIAAMREGNKRNINKKTAVQEKNLTKIPLASRLANFVSATSIELEERNAQLANMNVKLKKASVTDGLTGLYNRKEIQCRVGASLQCVKEGIFSVIMLDIDNFKQINDTYGHQEGDNVIIALAKILQDEEVINLKSFSSGRWGGEEFMIMLPDCDIEHAKAIAERIRQAFANMVFQQAKSQTVSIGVSQARVNDTIDSLCVRVDEALYDAKQTGKNKVVVC